MKRITLTTLLLFLALSAISAQAAVKYWDINGATAGSGQGTATGTWNTSGTTWTTDPTGSSGTTTFASGDTAVFSAGTDGISAFAITVPSALTIGGLTNEEGTVSISGAALTIGTGVVTVKSGAKLSIAGAANFTASTGAILSLDGSTMENTATANAGSFVNTAMAINVGSGGATLSFPTVNILNIVQTPGTIISGPGGITKVGAGVLAIATACTYQGPTIVNAGELRIRSTADRIPVTTAVTVNSPGIFNINGVNQTIGSLSGNGSVGLANGLLTVGDSTSTVFNGIITDTANAGAAGSTSTGGKVTKVGSGTLTFGGLNAFTGPFTNLAGTTTVNAGAALCSQLSDLNVLAGTVNLNNAAQPVRTLLGAGTINLGPGNVLTINPSASSTFSGTLAGAGGITKISTITTTLSGNNSYDGPTLVNVGRLSIASATALGSAVGDTTVASGAELLFDGVANSFTINEPIKIAGGGVDGGVITIQNSANITIAGPVTLTADCTNTVSSTATAVYSNPNSFTSVANQNLTLQGGSGAGGGGTISGIIALGTGGLNKLQGGRWTLSGANTYGGDTSIGFGTIRLGADGVIPDGPGKGNMVLNPAAGTAILDVNGKTETINGLSSSGTGASVVDNTSGNGRLTIGANDQSSTFNGVIKNTAGSLAITKTGAGTLTLGGANTYNGDTTINTGTVAVGNVSAIPSGAGKGNLSLAGTLDLNGNSITLNGLFGSGLVSNGVAGSITLTVGGNDASGLFGGTIVDGAGSLSLVKVGTNNLVLAAANTFSGNTTISNGMLVVSNGAVASASVTVSGGGTLAGSGAIPGTVDLSGTISPGASPGAFATASQNWNGGGHYSWQINNATNTPGADPGWDLLQITGGLNITAAATNKFKIDIASLSTNVPGLIDGFDAGASNVWLIAQTTEGITNFDANAFQIVQAGFSNDLGGQIFAISVDNDTNLVLTLKSNSAPSLTVAADQTVDELTTLTVTNTATDPDAGTALTFNLVAPPSGMTIDPATGVISWTPSEAQGPGSFTITVVVSDDAQSPLRATNTFNVTVNEVNSTPTFAGPGNQTINELTTLNVSSAATDSDIPANTLTYSLENAPGGMTIDSGTGAISWSTTEADGPGVYSVKVLATDNGAPSLTATNTFTVTVNEVNSAPLLTVPSDQTINEQALFSVSASASDSDIPANVLTFSLPSAPAAMTIDPNTGAISWMPTESDGPAVYTVAVAVTDNGTPSLSVTNTFTVTVSEVNSTPSLIAPADQTIDELTALNVSASATDPDLPANALAFSLGAHPSGVTIVPGTGAISWTPSEAQGPSTNVIEVIVTDDGVPPLSTTNVFTVVVHEVNVAPSLTVPADQTIDELTSLNVTNTATDTDLPANVLTFSLGEHPTGMTITPDTGIVSWTPTEAQGPSSNVVEVIVTDDGSPVLTATNTFAVVVNEVNSAPSLTVPANQTIDELTTLNVSGGASDSDIPANTLTFSLASAPLGMTIDPNTGAMSWTPTESDGPALYTVAVAVTDDGTPPLSITNSFTVTVNEVNTAPLLTVPADQTINELATLNVSASATDSDLPANTLTFSLLAPPAGMTIVPATGSISWTPAESQGPSTNIITVIVTDNGTPALSATNSFTVTVNEVNTAPSLPAIADRTIHAGQTLTFTNSATDSDVPANTLAYSLDPGAPAGASVGSSSGVFTWATTVSDANTTNAITVRVTDDGTPPLDDSKSFTVTVVSAPTADISVSGNVVTISWTSIAGQTYRVQYKDNIDDASWTDLAPDVTASGSTASTTDTTTSQRFYRVAALP